MILGLVFGVKLSGEGIADFEVLRDVAAVAMATIFGFCIYEVHIGATWRLRMNRPCPAAMVKLLRPLVEPVVNVIQSVVACDAHNCIIIIALYILGLPVGDVHSNTGTVMGNLVSIFN